MAGIESLGTVRFLIFEFKGVFRFGDKFRGEMNVSFLWNRTCDGKRKGIVEERKKTRGCS